MSMSSSEGKSESDGSTRESLSSIAATMDPHSETTSAVSDATSAFTDVIIDPSPIIPPTITYHRNVRRQMLPPDTSTRTVDLSRTASNYDVREGLRRLRMIDGAVQQQQPTVASGKLEETSNALEFSETNDKRAFKICKRMLSIVITRRYGDDYGTYSGRDIIKKPVSLSTVESRLEDNCYSCPREFAVMMNAARFNLQTNSYLHMQTTQILLDFNKAYKEEEAKYKEEEAKYNSIRET